MGTARWMEAEDLSEQEEVDREGKDRKWTCRYKGG